MCNIWLSFSFLIFFSVIAKLSLVCAENSITTATSSSSTAEHSQRTILDQQQRQPFKRLLLLRHGQATHNPRAEKAREKGCSYEEFLDWIRQDDEYDAPLTTLGEQQAQSVHAKYAKVDQNPFRGVDLVVSSPLSRALQTADLALPPHTSTNTDENNARRICLEPFREINGSFLNAKRRPKSELQKKFRHWDFDLITEEDETWTASLESQTDCAERGYQGLLVLTKRTEEKMLVVSHGGILRFSMNQHENIRVLDGRDIGEREKGEVEECKEQLMRDIKERFGNCELREYIMNWSFPQEEKGDTSKSENGHPADVTSANVVSSDRPIITLTEVTRGSM
mmetsp:Transcript_21450/g.31076  ORF Transcript_21450/g.31076 Transcript_21450/m.31076 type:complete len:338 (+) Transcript_21450:815-1828(+)